MKLVEDGRRVMRGQISTGTYNGSENRLQLFDGLFTTGYKIISFKIAPSNPLNAQEFMATLSTEADSGIADWDWQSNTQVGWAGFGFNGASYTEPWDLIDEDAIIVDDLFISSYTTGTSPIDLNYYIVIEKYSFNDWVGALNMVRNRSQA